MANAPQRPAGTPSTAELAANTPDDRDVAERAPGPVLPVGDADPRDPAMPVRALPRQCRFIGVLADRNILRKGQGAPAAERRRIEAVRQIVRHDRTGRSQHQRTPAFFDRGVE